MVGGPPPACPTPPPVFVRPTPLPGGCRPKRPAEVAPAAQRDRVARHRRDVVARDELEVRDARLAPLRRGRGRADHAWPEVDALDEGAAGAVARPPEDVHVRAPVLDRPV